MKKIIMTIGGSPRKDGYSARMLKCFTESFHELSVEHLIEIRHYNAFDCAFAPCNDCRACCKSEGCINHDMDDFFHDFETADAIVIATPIYNMSFPAPLKAIIDRMQRYYNARFSLGKRPPIEKHRPVALLASAGAPDENGEMMIKQLKQVFTVINCELISSDICNGTDKSPIEDFPDPFSKSLIGVAAGVILENINIDIT